MAHKKADNFQHFNYTVGNRSSQFAIVNKMLNFPVHFPLSGGGPKEEKDASHGNKPGYEEKNPCNFCFALRQRTHSHWTPG
jgi:hypothetical protein